MQLPVDFLHWTLSLLPIVALAVLIINFQWTAQQAGVLSIFVAAAVAVFAFRTPIETLAVAGGKGVWDAIFILLVIWPALLLFQIMSKSGGYEAMRQGITRMSRNELFIILALGWVFTSFLQGIDGFGTPIAIVAPLLVAFGVKPVYAVVVPVIAHLWARFFGTLGVGWLATLQIVDLDEGTVAAFAFQSALLMVIQTLSSGVMIVWMYGRWAALRHAWPLILIHRGRARPRPVPGGDGGSGARRVPARDGRARRAVPAREMEALRRAGRWPRRRAHHALHRGREDR